MQRSDFFLENLEALDVKFNEIKKNQKPGHVLRYVGDLHGDLQKDKGLLDVKLISVPKAKCPWTGKGI